MAEETPNPQSDESVEQEISEETPITDESESDELDTSKEEVVETESEEDSNLVQSERGKKRIQELAEKAKKADELKQELESLKSRLLPNQHERTPDDILDELRNEGVPYTGDYLRDLQLAEQRAAEKALRAFEKRQAVVEKFKDDISEAEKKYAELNPNSDKFDADLTNEIVRFYRKANPNMDPRFELGPFVDDIMRIKNRSEKKGKSLSVQEIVEQEQLGALRPTASGVKRENKDPKEMTLEELEEIVPR